MLRLTTKSWMTSLMICCYLAVIVGCSPFDEKDYLDLNEKTQLGAYISLAVVTSTPEPDGGGGKLEVGDSCPDCGGRGMVGDGTIESKCNRCNGTGKIQPNDPDVADVASLDPQRVADIKSGLKDWIADKAIGAIENRSTPAEPPRFAPTSEDKEGGSVLPWSPEPDATPELDSDGIPRPPSMPSQKPCLCGPECPCGGLCISCDCIYCGLPEPGPGPLLSQQPLIASYVFKDGSIFVKEGDELKPVE
jgi:hypothetical protein